MVDIIEVETERLKLRQWKMEDRQFFANINADPEVMNFYLSVLNTKESNDIAQKFELLIAERGWGFWAVEKIDEKKFIGFVGLHEPTYDLPVMPYVEIDWRPGEEHWGHGYAAETAKVSL